MKKLSVLIVLLALLAGCQSNITGISKDDSTVSQARIYDTLAPYDESRPIMSVISQVKNPSQSIQLATSTSNPGWTNPDYLFASDNLRAFCDLPESGMSSNLLHVYQCGFTIPAGYLIRGIKVVIEGNSDSARVNYTAGLLFHEDEEGTQEYLGTGVTSSTAWPITDGNITLGGASSLWGATLTPAIVNDPSFGVLIQITNNLGVTIARIDCITITVYYEADATTINASMSFGVGVGVTMDADLGYPNVAAESTSGVGVGFSMNAYLDIPATINMGIGVYSSHAENNKKAALKVYADKVCYHFERQDVLAVVESETIPSIIHEFEDGHIIQYQTGIATKQYSVTIRPTLTNVTAVKALQTESGIMYLHWDYWRNPSEFQRVKIDPRLPLSFYAGAIDAETDIRIVFYQTA